MDPIPILITYGISFIPRAYSFDMKQLPGLITAAIRHKGMSVVYIHSPCVNYQAMSWEKLKEKTEVLPPESPIDDRLKALVPVYSKDQLYAGIFYQAKVLMLEERLDMIAETAKKSRSEKSAAMTVKRIRETFR